jgi:2-acylglycerol O-acyltransferase 2
VLRQKEHILAAPTGVRVWCDGLAPTTSRQPFWEEALALATLALFVAWVHVVFALTVAAFFNRWAAAAAALLWATTLLPPGPLLWQAFLSNAVFRMWRRYFRFSVAYDGAVDLSQHYVFAEVPHAVFPLSQIVACSRGADAWREHKVGWAGGGGLGWRGVRGWCLGCPF